MKALAAIAMIGAAAAGCTSVTTKTIETGILENNPDKLVNAFEDLRKKLVSGEKVTIEDLECIGFNLKAPNVELVPGKFAFNRVLGNAVFQDENGAEKTYGNLGEFAQFSGYSIPYQSTTTTSDRIYISELEIFHKGVVLQVFLLVDKEGLCGCGIYSVVRDTYYCHYALFEGVIIAIKSPGKAALGLLKKLEEYKHPGLDYFIPIPIP